MPQLRMPTTGEFALLSGLLVYMALFPILGYKGFAYVAGILFFSLGLRWQIAEMAKRECFTLRFYWWGFTPAKSAPWTWKTHGHWVEKRVPMPGRKRLSRLIGQALIFASLVVLPVFALVIQRQGVIFSNQIDAHLPSILSWLDAQLQWLNQRLGTNAEVNVDAGLSGLKDTFAQFAGNALTDVSDGAKGVVSGALKLVGVLINDYILLCIAAVVVAMLINGIRPVCLL